MSDNIKVVVKVRPLISREIEEKLSYQWLVKNNTLHQLDYNGKYQGQFYTFDKVYDKDAKTLEVYNDIAKPIVEAATAGFNGTIFAYGQTSSGKTYTMTGTDESPGIIPLAVINLFDIIKNEPDRDFLVRVSYLEIYNETVKDLLNPEKENIKIHDTINGIKVDVSEKVTSSPEEVLEAMKEGEVNRQKGATNMNEQSSRSHSIFQITIESREHVEGSESGGCVNVSQLNLVDLAGSERAGQTGATGIRFKEGTHINKSLSSLALVIKQLSEDPNKYANYRDSKLTRILQNSLGGNAKTSIICAVTPAAVEETISTLQFANRAKAIKNKPAVNAVATDATMIQSLTKQMSKLQSQLESKKYLEKDNEKLQKQIASLQRLILNGFGARRTVQDGARRKLQQQRRITISAFESVDKDTEFVAPAPYPKFRTPILKYNPNTIPQAAEFLPIQNSNVLTSVPEEPAERLITPPLNNKKVNFNDEVIEIDSDDDSVPEEPCSPYHTCQGASVTPPCILRKNAKLAEKHLKDILELTEREKIYTPSVVELMEKLEQNTAVICRLQDEVATLVKQQHDKDLEMDQLKNKIKSTEEEMKTVTSTKVELQTKCINYETQLTEWEVSFDTLKKRAKLREEELLSRLEEFNATKTDKISKQVSQIVEKNILDISLVNNDNINYESTDETCDLITATQTQLNLKNQALIELEANLFHHKHKIASLEDFNQELQDTVNNLKEKLVSMENENSLVKSAMKNLNSTIDSQKLSIEKAQNDIKSYCSVIQELQIKLAQKENMPNININDSVLETMIANEEIFIANNENMKNIINSLKIALNCRTNEINQLKSTLESNNNSDSETLTIELETKSKQISALELEVKNLQQKVKENTTIINKLMHENNNLKELEQKHTTKLLVVEEKRIELEKSLKEIAISTHTLTQENEHLKDNITDMAKNKLVIMNLNEDLLKQISDLSTKIIDLESVITAKDELISSLNREDIESKENIKRAKLAIHKIQDILGILTGEMNEVPELIDNFVNIFGIFSDNLNMLEIIATNIVEQKEQAIKSSFSLKDTIKKLIETHQIEITEKQNQIDELIKIKDNYISDKEILILQLDQLKEEHEKIIQELQLKVSENNTLKTELIKQSEEIISKDNIILTLTAKDKELTSTLDFKQNFFDQELLHMNTTITILSSKLQEIEILLEDKSAELEKLASKLYNVEKGRDEILTNILNKATDLTDRLNIENKLTFDFEENFDNIYDRILLTLYKIEKHITFINTKIFNYVEENVTELIEDDGKESSMKKHLNLSNEINHENKHSGLLFELEKIQIDNKSLNEHLISSQEILQSLKKELKLKANEISIMEQKVQEWKDQFLSLDNLTKQQMHELHLENEYLKAQFHNLKKNSDISVDLCENSNLELNSNKQLPPIDKSSEVITVPSLLTICCNKIIDAIQTNENDCKTTPSSSDTIITFKDDARLKCQCDQLSLELIDAQTENSAIMKTVEELEIKNHNLVIEQKETWQEITSLLEIIHDLKKKLMNHRTNLSILTATTYAENQSLKFQLKVLQHHHKGFHNVCQKDIPNFKKQLHELMLLLNGDTLMTDQNTNYKRFSQPNLLDSSSAVYNFKNESILDGDPLMLDTNITLTTAADNTLSGHDQTSLDLTQAFYNETSQVINLITNDNKLYECNNRSESNYTREKLENELKLLSQKLLEVNAQKTEIEQKYNNLLREMPSMDAMITKLNSLEKEYSTSVQEITKLNRIVDKKSNLIKSLQEENNTLSTQVMDNISESEYLNKELETFKEKNIELMDKCHRLEKSAKELDEMIPVNVCSQCLSKDDLIESLRLKISKTKLNRSLSDSETSSRYNKICTLQSELHAGREDCKKLTEDVAKIKNHLERSNISMDLDESMGESTVFTQDLGPMSPQSKKCIMPDIPEERHLDVYTMDKIDCFNYYLEKTGIEKHNLNHDMRIADVMKMLYEKLTFKHGREIEHFSNTLQEHNQAKSQLQTQIDDLKKEYSKLNQDWKKERDIYSSIADVLPQIRYNVNLLNQQINPADTNKNIMMIKIYKENFLKLIDTGLGLSTVCIFEFLVENTIDKYHSDVIQTMEQYKNLQNRLENVTAELTMANENLTQIKSQLSEKENEHNLLKTQNEINNAEMLDMVKSEKELNDIITEGYQRLVNLDILSQNSVDLTLPRNKKLHLFFEHLIAQNETLVKQKIETDNFKTEINKLLSIVKHNENELTIIKNKNNDLQDINNNITHDLINKDNKIEELQKLNVELNRLYEGLVDEHKCNEDLMHKMSMEVNSLKNIIQEKEKVIERLDNELNIQKQKIEKENDVLALLNTIKNENETLKALNQIITQEKETYMLELQKSGETINQNNIDLDRMTSDILVLRKSVKDNVCVIEELKLETTTLLKENLELKEQLEVKCHECARLESNIKTHEKTAEIQTRIITRLENLKAEEEKVWIEKTKKLEELAQKYTSLQTEYDSIKICKDENVCLRKTNESLEARVAELQAAIEASKLNAKCSQRRHTMLDSKRFSTADKQDLDDCYLTGPKQEDLFMDVNEDSSSRSTPIGLSIGRESLSLSKTDQSDKEEEPCSRPSSVFETRRRRQSTHDLQRTVRLAPSPHDIHSDQLMDELNKLKSPEANSVISEVPDLKQRLAACEHELEELKERYRELDEECETCAQYLRDSEQRCARLKKEKAALQETVVELKEKLQSCNLNLSQQLPPCPQVAHAAVNTDEDWANLHAVVVDRMSFDAEVDKNKRLTKIIEELRFKKQDLKNTLVKMQKALEKSSSNRELEATKHELDACKKQVQELREKNRELDEECETCAKYLRDKEEHCRKLKETKAALEAKLQELQECNHSGVVPRTCRRKRQSAHDQLRGAALHRDVATETTDFLSYQVERDNAKSVNVKETEEKERLKMLVEKLSAQKAALEQQVTRPLHVATGSAIVQNQQLTDVMKENQKLKKMNAKLINICKKRGRSSNRENEDPSEQGAGALA